MHRILRHPGVDPNVVSIDDHRIIRIFPGAAGELTTWDGISVKLEKNLVRMSSETARPVDVRLLNTTITKIDRLDEERVIPFGR